MNAAAFRLSALARIRHLRTDRLAIRECGRTYDPWIACQMDAGTFGDRYVGLYLHEAVELIDDVIADQLAALSDMRPDPTRASRKETAVSLNIAA